jgi:hypothetical protein
MGKYLAIYTGTETATAASGWNALSPAERHAQEEAARLFAGHPHFSIFPGEAVEVMPVLPIPGQ